jgi:hypothetical protein
MSASSFTVIRDRIREEIGREPPGGLHGQDPEEVITVLTDVLSALTGQECRTSDAHPGGDPRERFRGDLTAEQIIVMACREVIRWPGEHDPVARRRLDDMLAAQEGQAGGLAETFGV